MGLSRREWPSGARYPVAVIVAAAGIVVVNAGVLCSTRVKNAVGEHISSTSFPSPITPYGGLGLAAPFGCLE